MANNPHTDRKIDVAVEQTFPASDPVSPRHITGTEEPGADPSRKAPKVTKEEIERAAVETEECPRCHGTGRVVSRKHDPAATTT